MSTTAPVVAIAQADASPNEACVEFLRGVLARAEAGEIQCVAVVVQNKDRSTGSGWSSGDNVYCTSMLGAMEALKLEYYEKAVKE